MITKTNTALAQIANNKLPIKLSSPSLILDGVLRGNPIRLKKSIAPETYTLIKEYRENFIDNPIDFSTVAVLRENIEGECSLIEFITLKTTPPPTDNGATVGKFLIATKNIRIVPDQPVGSTFRSLNERTHFSGFNSFIGEIVGVKNNLIYCRELGDRFKSFVSLKDFAQIMEC